MIFASPFYAFSKGHKHFGGSDERQKQKGCKKLGGINEEVKI